MTDTIDLTEHHSDFGAAFEAGQAAAATPVHFAPVRHNAAPLTLIELDGKLLTIDPDAPGPRHGDQVSLVDAASLVAYVQRHGTARTVLFVDPDVTAPTFVAIVDYHDGPAQYGWGKHRVTFRPVQTPEWKRWTAASGKAMTQVDFAQFLEDNLPDIAAPTGAEVLEVARTLEVKRLAQFRSSVRLDNGQTQLLYEEDLQGSAAKGTLQIPHTLVLGLTPFLGAEMFQVEARFRYRLREGVLSLWVELVRPHKVIEAAINEVLDDLRAGLPTTPMFMGPAPAAQHWAEAIR